MGDPVARATGKPRQRAQLIKNMRLQFRQFHVDPAPAEAHAVGKADMRAQIDPVILGQTDGAVHDDRIARVITAGDIGRTDLRHQRIVVGDAIGTETLAHVGIDVDDHGCSISTTVSPKPRIVPGAGGAPASRPETGAVTATRTGPRATYPSTSPA